MPAVEFEKAIEGSLLPEGDVDVYEGYAREPEPQTEQAHGHGEHGHEKPAFPPHRVAFQVKKDGDGDLKVTLRTFKEQRLQVAATMEVKGNRWQEIEAVTNTPGNFDVFVEALDKAAKPKNPAYLLRWSLIEPVKK